jgi:ABC-2 type transport system ATP-binding protein
MPDAAVRTEGLTKHFGPVRAVDDLDLVIERGEVFGYLGPNGAGKTTTVRLLLDFLRPTAGRAVVLGGSGGDPEIRRRIGYLPGDLRLEPDYTGTDVIELFGSLRGGFDRPWVDSLLERFGLDPSRRVGELSTGNRRKVGVVQAFMSRPELLLLDEPTSGLDPLLQHEFNALVREVVAEGATVLLSSHVLPEACPRWRRWPAGSGSCDRGGWWPSPAWRSFARPPASASSSTSPVIRTPSGSGGWRASSRRRPRLGWCTSSSRARSTG